MNIDWSSMSLANWKRYKIGSHGSNHENILNEKLFTRFESGQKSGSSSVRILQNSGAHSSRLHPISATVCWSQESPTGIAAQPNRGDQKDIGVLKKTPIRISHTA